MKTFKCCLCGDLFKGYGNNPQGAAYKDENGEIIFPEFKDNDRCCDICDSIYVIPGRICTLNKIRAKNKK